MIQTEFATQIIKASPLLKAAAMKFTGNSDDADDLVQDTFAKAIRYSEKFEEGTNIKGWLFTILRNTFINNYRKKMTVRDVVEQSDDLNSHQLMLSATSNNGETNFVLKDIKNALAKLPAEYSRPFLRYFEGYKYHEIALELQIPIGTVKTRIHMARRALKKELKVYNK